jgi:hypothetical protein
MRPVDVDESVHSSSFSSDFFTHMLPPVLYPNIKISAP